MARDLPLLTSTSPTAIASTSVTIGHVQLRDLIICPRERGIVNYVQHNSIVEHDLNRPDSTPRTLVKLPFQPNTLASLPVSGTDDTLLAAGGQEAEIHLSYHSPLRACPRQNSALWHAEFSLPGSINNSVLLTSMSLTRSNESSVEPRLGISNNDCTVRFYNVPLRGQSKRLIDEVGCLNLNVPINHSSISPDGRTLLSVGDSAKVYLHRMTGGSRISFSPIATLKLPPPTNTHINYASASLTASFSSAFSADGSKFAVASQEGLLAVWDVRSSRPLKVFQTEKSRVPSSTGNGSASGWLADDIFDWAGGSFKAPGWSVRNVKFGGSGDKELMTFTEHTSLLHVVDARTFETEEIIQVPGAVEPPTPIIPTRPSFQSQTHLSVPSRRTPRPPTTQPSRVNSPRTTPANAQLQATIIRALSDTFRISSPYSPPSSISDSTWRALRMSESIAGVGGAEEGALGSGSGSGSGSGAGVGSILVIPPFGDPDVEADVHALLGSHGIRSRTATAQETAAGRRGEEGDDADADADAEEDRHDREQSEDSEDPNTGSTHADYDYVPAPAPTSRRPFNLGMAGTRFDHPHEGSGSNIEGDRERDEELESCTSSRTPSRPPSPSPGPLVGVSSSRRGSPGGRRVCDVATYVDDLDIAGTCFDPSGRWVYVASKESVVEWGVRGAEKRWWAGSEWR
ncbi:hypothetical protein H0H92_012531 [Tricholoma furcatifolium]|nr:hypothetical protein H0H92_012531 [Tricholoma furcatifolium]